MHYISVALLLLCSVLAYGQPKELEQKAAIYEREGLMEEVALLYKEYLQDHPTHKEALKKYAHALYHIQSFEASLEQYEQLYLLSKKNTKAKAALGCARSAHMLSQFSVAKDWYKEALRAGITDHGYEMCVLGIEQTALGQTLASGRAPLIIENMGDRINTAGDECQIFESPNYEERIYFSSAPVEKVIDDFDSLGNLVGSRQSKDLDMYAAELVDGAWKQKELFEPELNEYSHEFITGFMDEGQSLMYYRPNSNGILKKQFQTARQDTLWKDWIATGQIRGLCLFADSLVLFASNRSGGFGGYDLYWSAFRKGSWMEPINLGSKINSEQNECFPFLSKNGRTLFFSGDGNHSIGGYDIFMAQYVDEMLQWSEPKNLGIPINSPANDLSFIHARSGLGGFLVSDRNLGYGGYDIYSITYQKPQTEQLHSSVPSFFGDVENYTLFQEGFEGDTSKAITVAREVFELPTIYYNEGASVITSKSKVELDRLIGFMNAHSHIELEILSHSDQSQVSNFDLFYAIKRAEEVAGYLIGGGISPDRIRLKGLGGNYPIAENETNGRPNPSAQYHNRRLDFMLSNAEHLPVIVQQPNRSVHPRIDVRDYQIYLDKRKGLSYAIQFANLNQMYKGAAISELKDVRILKNANGSEYRYVAAILPSFEEALKYRREIAELYQSYNSKIVPFIDGMALDNSDINKDLLASYPDLKNYVLSLQ